MQTWTILRIRPIACAMPTLRYADWDRELDDLADNGGRTNHNA